MQCSNSFKFLYFNVFSFDMFSVELLTKPEPFLSKARVYKALLNRERIK